MITCYNNSRILIAGLLCFFISCTSGSRSIPQGQGAQFVDELKDTSSFISRVENYQRTVSDSTMVLSIIDELAANHTPLEEAFYVSFIAFLQHHSNEEFDEGIFGYLCKMMAKDPRIGYTILDYISQFPCDAQSEMNQSFSLMVMNQYFIAEGEVSFPVFVKQFPFLEGDEDMFLEVSEAYYTGF